MGNETRVQVIKTGQITTTVPRAIAEAMRLKKGDSLEWIFERGDIIIRKI